VRGTRSSTARSSRATLGTTTSTRTCWRRSSTSRAASTRTPARTQARSDSCSFFPRPPRESQPAPAARSSSSPISATRGNVRYGAWYLDHLRQRYGDIGTALAAYHAGQGNVDRWRREGLGTVFPETRAYVAEVERVRRVYEKAYGPDLNL
jgi:hypothetical protein